MRLKDLVYINSSTLPEDTSSSYSFNYIDISSVSGEGEINMDAYYNFGEAPSRARRIVKKGDVLISTVRTYLRAITDIDFDAKDTVASTGFAVCSPKKNIASKYLSYAVRNNIVIADICKESTGVSYPAITAARLSSIEIPFCEIAKQQAIADYLDKKTAEIDTQVSLIDKKVTVLQKLKQSLISSVVTKGLTPNVELRDSGIEWLGTIPAHWEVKRFKSFAKTIKGKSDDYLPNYVEDSHKVLSLECLRQDDAQFYNYVFVDDKEQICNSNDIVVIWDGAGIGEFLRAKDGVLSSTIAKVKITDKKMLLSYLWYWRYKIGYVLKSRPTGMGIPHLNPNLLNNLMIAVPPLAEQQAIADYLDKKTAEIDTQIDVLNKKATTYKKLKQSLIDEVVTGKRKI